MYKVREHYVGKLILKGNRQYTLYNSLDQGYLEYLHTELGSEYIYYKKLKTITTDVKSK